jgi:hypothetical protein
LDDKDWIKRFSKAYANVLALFKPGILAAKEAGDLLNNLKANKEFKTRDDVWTFVLQLAELTEEQLSYPEEHCGFGADLQL